LVVFTLQWLSFVAYLGQTSTLAMRSYHMTSRRQFVIQFSAASAALGTAHFATAQANPMVAEADPQAKALGYATMASKVDKTKYPQYAAGQACSSCALYKGKPDDKAGACPLFAGKQVSGKAWCSAWAKKA
jgi:High potential iron-sulfur protein